MTLFIMYLPSEKQLTCVFTPLPVQTCATLPQRCVLSHGYCSKVRCTGHLGLSHMIHSMCHCSTPGVTYTVFCLCGLNHYYKLEMWKMCEFDNGGWWWCVSAIVLSAN